MAPVPDKEHQLFEARGIAVHHREGLEGPLCGLIRFLLRAAQAVDPDERGLALLGIAPGALAQSFPRRGSVEEVVHDLETEPELYRVFRDRRLFLRPGPRQDRAYSRARLYESTGLVSVDDTKRLGVRGLPHAGLVHLEDLLTRALLVDGNERQRLSEEGVAGEDRHSLTVLFVGRRPSPPEIVVVH